jgi:hypothetical protein
LFVDDYIGGKILPQVNSPNSSGYNDWGSEWSGSKRSRGYSWTENELRTIKEYFDTHQNPFSETKAADLLRYIGSNASLRKLFHPYHVQNSSRIRNGIERVKNIQEIM